MYHCHLRFYYMGRRRELLETIQAVPPLRNFTHTFLESDCPEQALAAQADVILADLRDLDGPETVQALAACKKSGGKSNSPGRKHADSLFGGMSDGGRRPLGPAHVQRGAGIPLPAPAGSN